MRRFTSRALLVAAVGAAILIGFLELPRVSAQSATADWEKAAGGTMSFDVVSVKPNIGSDRSSDSNVPLFNERYPNVGGLFSARNQPVSSYIAFAYKLTLTQTRLLNSDLPKWAADGRFDIQARGPEGITKDQMRLMMQSLLADRFGLKGHFEARNTKVYALELVKAGVTGSKLQPHSDNPPCDDTSMQSTMASDGTLIGTSAGFPIHCGSPVGFINQSGAGYGARNVTMQTIAEDFVIAPNSTPMDRPVIDQTGLTGKFDFIVNYSPQSGSTNPQADDTGPSLFEAVKDQLGLKLEAITAPFNNLVVDHIEEPTPN